SGSSSGSPCLRKCDSQSSYRARIAASRASYSPSHSPHSSKLSIVVHLLLHDDLCKRRRRTLELGTGLSRIEEVVNCLASVGRIRRLHGLHYGVAEGQRGLLG